MLPVSIFKSVTLHWQLVTSSYDALLRNFLTVKDKNREAVKHGMGFVAYCCV